MPTGRHRRVASNVANDVATGPMTTLARNPPTGAKNQRLGVSALWEGREGREALAQLT
jgi:hypothetical protein